MNFTPLEHPASTLSVDATWPRSRGGGGARAGAVLWLLGFVALGAAGCRKDQDPAQPAGQGSATGAASADAPADSPPVSFEDRRARERAAAAWANDDTSQVLQHLEPLIERENPQAIDLVSGALIAKRVGDFDRAQELLDRAHALEPQSARVNFNLGLLAMDNAEFESAARYLEHAHELLPDDVSTRLALGSVLEESDPQRALDIFQSVREQGFDNVGGLYLTAVYRICMLAEDGSLKDAACEEFDSLQGRGFKIPNVADGPLGTIAPPSPLEPAGGKRTEPGPLPAFASEPSSTFPELAGATGILCEDLDNDGELDVLAWGPFGVRAGLNSADGVYVVEITSEAPSLAIAFDLGNDDDLDLVLANGSELQLRVAELYQAVDDGLLLARWSAPRALATLPSAPAQVLAVDYDHDGDLDLATCGSFGARLLRNDGAAGAGSYVDATREARLPDGIPFTWIVSEDFDTDQDVDLLFGGPEGLYLASSLRGGVFEDHSARLQELAPSAQPLLAADLTGNGRPDLVRLERLVNRGEDTLVVAVARALPSGVFELAQEASTELPSPGPGALSASLVDLDLDAALDLVVSAAGPATRLSVLRSVGLAAARVELVDLGGPSLSALEIVDYDADLAWEAVASSSEGISVWNAEASIGTGLLFAIRGLKDNRRGVGTVVELRNGAHYLRTYWRGRTGLVGLGRGCELDWLRLTWPNGVVQYDPRLDCGDRRVTVDAFDFLQSDGLEGSCPFLYTWNGETYEFISDVLGITPLGLPMEPGLLVPPDHDEYVLVAGEQLVEKDGFLDLQFTEELREVTYLDRVRLDVVDHPLGSLVFPNERFSFPPFPEPHIHTVRGALRAESAIDLEGRDWTAQLAETDDDYAAPFELAPAQYRGIATPHVLELSFDPERVRAAPKLRLVMTGWFQWSNASVNVAVARDPDWSFVAPTLSVPDGQGGWVECGPPLGFPAGKTKTMVIDVTELLLRDDPRLRLFSTLELYWDSIHLAVCGDDDERRVSSLEPVSSRLWRRGFSAPERELDGQPLPAHQPERFVWGHLSEYPRWNPHPGLYTKLGETLPLVTAIDDRFVVMGTGDALHVRFDARQLPPVPEGFRRDYLVFLDGWAKDRDPNTVEALYVEPLPFHGMSGYPYRADESFPDTPAHRAWRREWQTRAPEPWITEDAPYACVARPVR